MVTRVHMRSRRKRPLAAFTLIEALLALAISGVVLAAIGGVFFSALRLRDRTFAALNDGSALQPAFNLLKRDLRGAMPPGGVLASSFRCGTLGGLLGDGFGLQLTTTTAEMNRETPSGDLQEVTYLLRNSTQGQRDGGMDLVRTVNRNLLATVPELPEEELLLSGVQLFEIECFDASEWRNSWDTTLTDTNLPVAVRVRLLVTPQENRGPNALVNGGRAATEIIVPLLVQSRTNAVSTETEQEETTQE